MYIPVKNKMILGLITAYNIYELIHTSFHLCDSHIAIVLGFVYEIWADKRIFLSRTLYLDFCYLSPLFSVLSIYPN